ncbi:MAG: hypothetical protein HYZ53_11510 [Planctomycetes bacterium]|nr:hypothetical protein [Planctomycetota bacterium]
MPVFEPTAGTHEFDAVPGLREAWSRFIADAFESNLYGAKDSAHSLLLRWGYSDVDLRFYNPASMPIVAGSKPANVFWPALPTSYDGDFGGKKKKLYEYLDAPQKENGVRSRVQDEYCEWVVERDASGKAVRILFTCEPPEFYDFLYRDPYGVGKAKTRALLLSLYRDRCGTPDVALKELEAGKGSKRAYDPYNSWNAKHCVHMQQGANTLFAEINIVAIAGLLRRKGQKVLTDAQALIDCGRYGEPKRQSDPKIGATINQLARENRFFTLENPVGLYMTGLNTAGWSVAGHPELDPQSLWKVRKGTPDADPARSMIVRAELVSPPGLTLSDVLIGGVPIRYGAQVAEQIQMRVGVLVSEPQAQLPPPHAIGCRDANPPVPPPAAPAPGRGNR